MTTEKIETLTIDGTEHNVADLTPEVQALVEIYEGWKEDADSAKLEMLKANAALRDLSREIGAEIRKAEAADEAPEVEAVEAVEVVATEEAANA